MNKASICTPDLPTIRKAGVIRREAFGISGGAAVGAHRAGIEMYHQGHIGFNKEAGAAAGAIAGKSGRHFRRFDRDRRNVGGHYFAGDGRWHAVGGESLRGPFGTARVITGDIAMDAAGGAIGGAVGRRVDRSAAVKTDSRDNGDGS